MLLHTSYLYPMETTSHGYFSNAEIEHLKKLRQQYFSQVKYHVWVNRVHPETDSFSLEWIEIITGKGIRTVLAVSDENDGIVLRNDFDAEAERKKMQELHGDKMNLQTIDMTVSEEWDPSLPLRDIVLNATEDGRMTNTLLHFNFGEQVVEITSGREGLIVEVGE